MQAKVDQIEYLPCLYGYLILVLAVNANGGLTMAAPLRDSSAASLRIA